MTDELVCENFEGVTKRYNYTADEWYDIVYFNKFVLIDTFNTASRKLMDTRLLRVPRNAIEKRIGSIINGTDLKSDLRYIIYSAHDT